MRGTEQVLSRRELFRSQEKEKKKDEEHIWGRGTHMIYGPKHAFFFFPLSFLGPHPQRMEVPRLGVKSEL